MRISPFIVAALFTLFASAALCADRADRSDLLFADFEAENWGQWKADGQAFGDGPAEGTLPGQMPVNGYAGKRLVNSFHGGDRTIGTLTSPEFRIERRYISFLIGGGGFEGKTCMNLLVDGRTVRTATGPNLKPGGSEDLERFGWDVADLEGKTARIQVVDNATGGWGHINVDHIVFTDIKPALQTMQRDPSRTIAADRKFLCIPVKNGAKIRKVKVEVDGEEVRQFTIEAADGQPDWWATLDVSAWAGKSLKITADQLPESSKFLTAIESADAPKAMDGLYREPLRPQFHFSPMRGWINDPNGLCYFNGEYHLFFQLNPYGTKWGNMHWGHAISKDLIHWSELPIALYPDRFGPMFSGSAVVDWKNTSGLGAAGKPPLVLIYTAAGANVQCIASSTDGRSFAKYDQNPVVKTITGGNRDPKVIWHEPTHKWVMALYVGFDEPAKPGQKKARRDTIHFLSSPDLKSWTVESQIDGFFECPDLFPLALDGDPKKTKWILTAASSDYMVGSFDGKTFTPETQKKKGHRGQGFYAAQTFSDIPAPDGRRIQIGWFQAPAPGMAFNQAMTVPLELKLVSTPEGPLLSWLPVKELEALRADSTKLAPTDLKPGDPNPLAAATGELLDTRLDIQPSANSEIELIVRGVKITYCENELQIKNHKTWAPLIDGHLLLTVLADRNCFELFAAGGVVYVPFPVIPKADEKSVNLKVSGGSAKIHSAEVHRLKSAFIIP